MLRRLLLVSERIDDTESLVAIALDSRRNDLVALNLVATLLTSGLAVVAAVAGVLGMNLSPLPVENSILPFIIITAGSWALGAAVFLGGLNYARRRELMWIPRVPR